MKNVIFEYLLTFRTTVHHEANNLFQEGSCPRYDSYCDFETDDLCGYTFDETADFLWTWKQGITTTGASSTIVDHSTGTEFGHYMITGYFCIAVSGHQCRFKKTYEKSKNWRTNIYLHK